MMATDSYWLAAAEALKHDGAKGEQVLAPEGFDAYMRGVQCYKDGDAFLGAEANGVRWLVVHKDHVDSIDLVSLASFMCCPPGKCEARGG